MGPEATPPSHPGDLLRQARWLLRSLQLAGVNERLRPLAQPPPAPSPSLPSPPCRPQPPEDLGAAEELLALRRDLGDCQRCRLHQGRTHLVFADGPATASLVLVGEGPGEEEDRRGLPFVGKAGKLLDQMIRAMGLERSEVYICNVVKCRPPGNRTPLDDEIATCAPFLFRQLEAIRPKAICALGATAALTLTRKSASMAKLRQSTHFWHGIPLVVTYHPAYLLRTPSQKAAVWQDLLALMALLG